MLTTTATFDKYKMRPNHMAKLLLKITGESPANTFYLSDYPINLSASSIVADPYVTDWGNIAQKIDIFNKTSSIGNVKIKLSNAPAKMVSGSMVCMSDYLNTSDIINRTAEIYIWFDGITNISDCLKIYSGLIQPMIEATPESLTLTIYDPSFLNNIEIEHLITAIDFPEASEDVINKNIPVIYGTYDIDGTYFNGAVVEAIWVSESKLLISNHQLDTIGTIWLLDEDTGRAVIIDPSDYSTYINDGGRGTVELSNLDAVDVTDYLKPLTIDPTNDVTVGETTHPYDLTPSTNIYLTKDLDTSSFLDARLIGNDGGTADHHISGTCQWWLPAFPIGNKGAAYSPSVKLQIHYHMNDDGGGDFNAPHQLPKWVFNSVETALQMTFTGDDQYKEESISVQWQNLSGAELELPVEYHCYDYHTNHAERSSFEINEVRVEVKYQYSGNHGPGITPYQTRIFAEVTGREYGAWVDEGARDNGKNQWDLIENPAHIVESILRDEVGMATSEIGWATFDSVASNISTWKGVSRIAETINSDDMIKKLCQQFKMILFYSEGLAKLATYDNLPSASFTLEPRDIVSIKIKQGNMKYLINEYDIDYLYWPPYDIYLSNAGDKNGTSQTDYNFDGIKSEDSQLVNDDTTATAIASHYAGSSGFWKDLRTELKIVLADYMYCDVEVSDTFALNPNLINYIKDFNANWSEKLFMVTAKGINKNRIEISAIKTK